MESRVVSGLASGVNAPGANGLLCIQRGFFFVYDNDNHFRLILCYYGDRHHVFGANTRVEVVVDEYVVVAVTTCIRGARFSAGSNDADPVVSCCAFYDAKVRLYLSCEVVRYVLEFCVFLANDYKVNVSFVGIETKGWSNTGTGPRGWFVRYFRYSFSFL